MARGEGPHRNARNISGLAVKRGSTDVIRWRRTLQRPRDDTVPQVRASAAVHEVA